MVGKVVEREIESLSKLAAIVEGGERIEEECALTMVEMEVVG